MHARLGVLALLLPVALSNTTCECPVGWVEWPETCTCVPCPGGFSCVGIPSRCSNGSYSPSGDPDCHPCASCDNGTFQVRDCGGADDVACHRCLKGFRQVNNTCQVEGLLIDERYGVGVFIITVAEIFVAAWWWKWWRNHKAYSEVKAPLCDYDSKP